MTTNPGVIEPIQPVPAEPPRRRGGGLWLNVLLGAALVVAVGGVAFAVGRATAPAPTATGRNGLGNGAFGGPNASGAPGAFGGGGGGFGGAAFSVQGTVESVAADSITIKLTSGQTVTIPTDAQTTYRQSEASTAASVTSGATVQVELQGGRGALNGGGNGNGGQGGGPTASGAPGRTLGPAQTITILPAAG